LALVTVTAKREKANRIVFIAQKFSGYAYS